MEFRVGLGKFLSFVGPHGRSLVEVANPKVGEKGGRRRGPVSLDGVQIRSEIRDELLIGSPELRGVVEVDSAEPAEEVLDPIAVLRGRVGTMSVITVGLLASPTAAMLCARGASGELLLPSRDLAC